MEEEKGIKKKDQTRIQNLGREEKRRKEGEERREREKERIYLLLLEGLLRMRSAVLLLEVHRTGLLLGMELGRLGLERCEDRLVSERLLRVVVSCI